MEIIMKFYYFFLIGIFSLLFSSAIHGFAGGENVLSIDFSPARGGAFVFGKIADAKLVIDNKSNHVIVVSQITPLSPGNEPKSMTRSVFGYMGKLTDKDAYSYYFDTQMLTLPSFIHGGSRPYGGLFFYDGLLLPGEKFTFIFPYRAIARQEKFGIDYYISTQAYDDTKVTLTCFSDIYIRATPEEDESANKFPLNMLDAIASMVNPDFPSFKYVPFSINRWKEITAENPHIQKIGPDAAPRSVLIPALKEPSRTMALPGVLKYSQSSFFADDARAVAATIADIPEDKIRLAYSYFFKHYVVFEDDQSWFLNSGEQKTKGALMALFPAVLLDDIDSSGSIRVRVGEQQRTFGPDEPGPDERKTGEKFWDHYPVYAGEDPVYAGNGTYTLGKFLHLHKKEILDFLCMALSKGKILKVHNYSFRSRYYDLENRKSK
jgi:hypothetical protein